MLSQSKMTDTGVSLKMVVGGSKMLYSDQNKKCFSFILLPVPSTVSMKRLKKKKACEILEIHITF